MPNIRNKVVGTINALFVALFIYGLVQFAWGFFAVPAFNLNAKSNIQEKMAVNETTKELRVVWDHMDRQAKSSRNLLMGSSLLIVLLSAIGIYLSSKVESCEA